MTADGRDPRLTPARPEVADIRLKGQVEADVYAHGAARRVVTPVADLRAHPRPDCPLDSQALLGETATYYAEVEGYAFVQLDRDGYAGWLPAWALGPQGPAPTHRVSALRTFAFPGPDMKQPVTATLPQGALVTVVDVVERRGLAYGKMPDGTAAVMRHLEPLDAAPSDFVDTAKAYVGTPYLWGGRTSLGIDCSGLVQTALAMAGVAAPRDTDMQEAAVGERLADAGPADLQRGDLVFWTGHVGIVSAPGRLLHANGFHMATVEEDLAGAIARIAAAGQEVTSLRRPVLSPGR